MRPVNLMCECILFFVRYLAHFFRFCSYNSCSSSIVIALLWAHGSQFGWHWINKTTSHLIFNLLWRYFPCLLFDDLLVFSTLNLSQKAFYIFIYRTNSMNCNYLRTKSHGNAYIMLLSSEFHCVLLYKWLSLADKIYNYRTHTSATMCMRLIHFRKKKGWFFFRFDHLEIIFGLHTSIVQNSTMTNDIFERKNMQFIDLSSHSATSSNRH